MKTVVLASCLLLGTLGAVQATVPLQSKPGSAAEQLPPYVGPKKPIVVLGIDIKVTKAVMQVPLPSGATQEKPIDLPAEFGSGLTEMLITELFATGRFQVLEVPPTDPNAPTPALGGGGAGGQDAGGGGTPPVGGAPVPSRTQVRGAVTTLMFRSSAQALGASPVGGLPPSPLEGGRAKTEAIVRLDLRVTESATGEVTGAYQAEGRVASSKSFLTLAIKDITNFNTQKMDDNPLALAVRQAIRNAVVKIAQQADKTPWEARVARVSGEGAGLSLYLTEGAKAGLEPGDELEVVRLGEEIRDPVTNQLLGRDEQKVGQCRIKSVPALQAFSVATPIEGEGFQVGDVVRFVKRPAKPAPEKSEKKKK